MEHRERYSRIHGMQQHIPIHLQRKSEIYYTVQVTICLHQCMWKGQKEKELIERIDEIAKVLHMAETADIALIGIGSMQKDSSIIKAEIRTKGRIQRIGAKRCGRRNRWKDLRQEWSDG